MTTPPTPPKPSGFVRAFLVSVLGTGLSRVLGAVRDIIIAAVLGAGASSDAFWVAFTVPSVFRRFVADEGLTGALIPAVARAESEEDPSTARHLANSVLTALIIANLGLCVAGFFGADALVYLFAAKFADDPAKFELTAQLTRYMMPFVGMVSLVSLMEGLLNHRQHFFVPKLAPGLVSAGIAAGAFVLAGVFDEPAWSLVAGLLVGGVAHVLVNVPFTWRLWGPLGLSFDFGDPRFRAVMRELSKVIAIGVFAQVNILVLRQLAALLEDGSVTRYWYANRLVDLSQGIIAVAIGSALLPGVTRAVVDADWQTFRVELVRAIRLAGFLLLPVAAVLLAFAEPITAILFRHGAYTWHDTQVTAATLVAMVPFMLSVAGINIIKKVYFALEERNTLLWVGGLGVLLTAGLGWITVASWGVVGLAVALSLSTTVQLGVYLAVLRSRLGEALGLGLAIVPLAKMSAASAPVALLLAWAHGFGNWEAGPTELRNFVVLGGSLGSAGCLYLGLSWLLGVEELHRVLERVVGRFRSR